jgi:hypothetical protein
VKRAGDRKLVLLEGFYNTQLRWSVGEFVQRGGELALVEGVSTRDNTGAAGVPAPTAPVFPWELPDESADCDISDYYW